MKIFIEISQVMRIHNHTYGTTSNGTTSIGTKHAMGP